MEEGGVVHTRITAAISAATESLRKRRRRLTYANVTSTMALVLTLSMGTAYAANEWTGTNIVDGSLAGVDIKNGSLGSADLAPNSVNGGRIADGTVKTVDLAPDSVDSSKVANDTVTGIDVKNESLTGEDIINNTITGQDVLGNSLSGDDIDESSLAEVPSATLGGLGRFARQDLSQPCNPNGTDHMPNICVQVEMNIPAQARVLLIGHVRAFTGGSGSASGSCGLWANGTPLDGTTVAFILPSNSHETATPLTMTPPIGPGSNWFQVVCYEWESAGDIEYDSAQIAAVAISPN